ncbi:hypothetical protein [Polyangium aurulentum]|uniref:hypothetical protein n=1 Tax=Polyangium aurulentum TaxID=2567896 RepID=UPI001139B451|nr:hypothetical protein [Polyangium aurulentum]UQA63012.1 hypothetical protein E8A73_022155 [Polyangium aurulentum]
MHERPSKPEIAAFQAEVKAACPSAPDGGPSPALSPGARDVAMEPRRVVCRYISLDLLAKEIRLLFELSRHTRKDDPVYPRIWERIAEAAFVLEYHDHRSCEDLASARPDERGRLNALRERLGKLTREIALARSIAARACDELARTPFGTPRVSCPRFSPPALAPPPPACMDALASRKEPALALTCGP